MSNQNPVEVNDFSQLSSNNEASDESAIDLKLFEAYRKGELDLDILSSQPRPYVSGTLTRGPPLLASATTSSTVQSIPRSWCALKSNTKQPQAISAVDKMFKPCVATSSEPVTGNVSTGDDQIKSTTQLPVTQMSIPSPNKRTREYGIGNSLLVNQRQRGNPILKFVRNVAWEYSDIEPDYVVGRQNCVYFLSMRYHNLNAEYIYERLRQTKQKYQLSVLLVQVDISDHYHTLKELCKLCLTEGLTLILAWTPEEAARYLEAYKALENKPPELLMPEPASSTDHPAQIIKFLTSLKLVSKTDAITSVTKFGTVADLVKTDLSSLEKCPGFGHLKARKLHDVFHMPFQRISNP